MFNNLEKGDVVAIRDAQGNTHTVTVLSVKPDYDHSGAFVRFDYINHNEASPMRRTAWPKELLQILKKTTVKPLDPKQPRPGDLSAPAKDEVFINGKRYAAVKPGGQGAIPVTPGVQAQDVVSSSAKPVESRIKKAAVATK